MSEQMTDKEFHILFEGAARLMNERGFGVCAPWECDLDDVERERYEALRDVVCFVAAESRR